MIYRALWVWMRRESRQARRHWPIWSLAALILAAGLDVLASPYRGLTLVSSGPISVGARVPMGPGNLGEPTRGTLAIGWEAPLPRSLKLVGFRSFDRQFFVMATRPGVHRLPGIWFVYWNGLLPTLGWTHSLAVYGAYGRYPWSRRATTPVRYGHQVVRRWGRAVPEGSLQVDTTVRQVRDAFRTAPLPAGTGTAFDPMEVLALPSPHGWTLFGLDLASGTAVQWRVRTLPATRWGDEIRLAGSRP
jgi:hypothetical protein